MHSLNMSCGALRSDWWLVRRDLHAFCRFVRFVRFARFCDGRKGTYDAAFQASVRTARLVTVAELQAMAAEPKPDVSASLGRGLAGGPARLFPDGACLKVQYTGIRQCDIYSGRLDGHDLTEGSVTSS